MTKSVAVVIQTCDEYQKFWEGWYLSFIKWWDFNIPWDIYFCNEQKELSFIDTQINEAGIYFNHPRIKQFKTPKSRDKYGFANRFKYIFENLDYDYIFYMQEDMWLTHTLSKDLLETLFKVVQAHNINSLKIHQQVPYWEYELDSYAISYIENIAPLRRLDKSSRWLMSHQATIWNRKFILPFLKENQTALEHEMDTTIRLSQSMNDLKFFIYSHNWYLQPVGAVSEGKLTPMGEEYLQILQHEHYLKELIRRKSLNLPLRPLMQHNGTPYPY